jgi:hypothetical protein
VGSRLAGTIALQQFDLKEHPRDLARQYDKSLRPPASAKKRSVMQLSRLRDWRSQP